MRISKELIAKIISASDIIEVVANEVALKKHGANYFGLSPFKTEKTPSFSVNPIKQKFKCFASGESGDVIEFLEKAVFSSTSNPFLESIKFLAAKYNIELPTTKQDSYEKVQNERLESFYTLLNHTNNFFAKNTSPFVEKLVSEREFTDETISKFEIGFAPLQSKEYISFLEKNGFSSENALNIGLLAKNEKNELYAQFRSRIIFPIRNEIGKLVGFGGRETEKGKHAKYLNSSQSVVFNKSKVLYGLFAAKEAIREKGFAYLCEGYTDVMRMWQSVKYRNAVASCGTAFTMEQAKLLKRFTKKVCIAYDGDNAGILAAKRAIPILLKEKFEVKILVFSEKEDPDSYLRKNGKLPNNHLEWYNFLIEVATLKNENDTTLLVNEIVAIINDSITDNVKKELIVNAICEKLKLSKANILPLVSKGLELDLSKNEYVRKMELSTNTLNYSEIKIHTFERYIIEILLRYGFKTEKDMLICEYVRNSLAKYSFSNKKMKSVWTEYFELLHDFGSVEFSDFEAHDKSEFREISRELHEIETLINSTYSSQNDVSIIEILQKLITTYEIEYNEKAANQLIKGFNSINSDNLGEIVENYLNAKNKVNENLGFLRVF